MIAEKDLVPASVVRNIVTGQVGVVCPELQPPMGCNEPGQVSVVYEGDNCACETDPEDLTFLRKEEAVADMKKCGAGKGAECCIFLVMGKNGPECQRFGDLRWSLIFKTMDSAERNPVELYPACQKF